MEKNKGARPTSYGAFLKTLATLPKPPLPIPPPLSIPDPGKLELLGWDRSAHSVEEWRKKDVNKASRETGTTERDRSYESFSGPRGDFAVPMMEELGMVAEGDVRGGETRALVVFEEFMRNEKRVAEFEKPKTSPAAFEPASSESFCIHKYEFADLNSSQRRSCRLTSSSALSPLGPFTTASSPSTPPPNLPPRLPNLSSANSSGANSFTRTSSPHRTSTESAGTA